jgi:uncharacterized protein Smg (DUF494 family)
MTDRYAVERIMEIIALVGTGLIERKDITMGDLQGMGYTESEIATALSWIMEREGARPNDAKSVPSSASSFRILHDIESDLLTPDAWGLVLIYRDLGFLSNEDIENILERAVLMGVDGGVSIADLKTLIANHIMQFAPPFDRGSRQMLSGGDSIH